MYIHESEFHLDIDSRDGKILFLQNKGWRGCNPCGSLTIQGMVNELPGMAGAIPCHPLYEPVRIHMHMTRYLNHKSLLH